uniref:ALMS motif domain-containing protein n=1 Tax=Leptobrachium leishanense TaxID=445787 RepID=A0A8C5WJS4_9ANUR
MNRKVAKVTPLRLSPNEEMLLIKQERERRRKLRLQQVREQEKFIAQQIRQDVRERREQQLQLLAEDLRFEWQAAQDEKLRTLEEAYQSSLRAIGEGHRQAKENEPDFEAAAKQVAANKEKAEMRHREALKELKQQREKEMENRVWHIKSRRKALHIEKERAAKIASLPPPLPDPLQNLEYVKKLPSVRICNVDNFSVSHYHLPEPCVDREMDREQPDARALAEEEAKRLDALQKEDENERREKMEKAQLRGSHALKMVHLTQDRVRFLKELEHLQQDDLARRRQIVAHMPQQLFEPAYRRAEIRDDRQRELESAFEDMYTRDQRMKGDLVLHLKPQPLPVPSIKSVDEDLDLSVEPEIASDNEQPSGHVDAVTSHQGPSVESREPPSRIMFKKLLSKIRTQKDQWCAKSDAETVSDTLESGSLPVAKDDIDAHPTDQESSMTAQPASQDDITDSVLAGDAVLLHPQEQAGRIRMAADKQKKMEDLERKKSEQLELLERLEEQRKNMEAELMRLKLAVQEDAGKANVSTQEKIPEQTKNPLPESERPQVCRPAPEVSVSTESPHVQIIREYQQRLLHQNRQHKQSVEEARRRLEEYQLLLKKRYSHLSTSHLEITDEDQRTANSHPDLNAKTKVNTNLRDPSSSSGLLHLPSGQIEDQVSQVDTFKAALPQPVPISRQASVQSAQYIPPVPYSAEVGAVDSKYVSAAWLGQPVHPTLSISAEAVTEKQVARPCTIPQRNGLVSPCNLTNDITTQPGDYGSEIRAEETGSPGGEYQCPEESRVGPDDSAAQPENQSSSSSLWEQDSLSDMFYPLPSVLSIGFPQIDPTGISHAIETLAAEDPFIMETVDWPHGEFSSVQEFRERLLSSSSQMQSQQDQLRELQAHLDNQRESLLSNQKVQENHLLQKHKALEEQMKKHQESLERYLGGAEPERRVLPNLVHVPSNERFGLMSSLLNALEGDEDVLQENGYLLTVPGREQRRRSTKPPVTKTKLGPALAQHELSAILEVETPTSGRCSSIGGGESKKSSSALKDRPGGEEFLIPGDQFLENSSFTSQIDLDLSRISTSSGGGSHNGGSGRSRSKLSWREILSLEANSSHELTAPDQSQTSAVQTPMSRHPANARASLQLHPVVRDRAPWFGNPHTPFSPPVLTLDPFSDHLSTTTISTGSFLTSENADSSPLNSEYLSELQKCNYSLIRPEVSPLEPLAPFHIRTGLSGLRSAESSSNEKEQQSQIQQIIEKYTKDLSLSLDGSSSFQVPAVAADISARDGNQYPLTFHPLDPKVDFNVSTPSYALSNNSRSSQGSSQCTPSSHERSSQQSHVSPNQLSNHSIGSSLGSINSPIMPLITRLPSEENRTLDNSTSFQPLRPECTLNETNPVCQDEGPFQDSSPRLGNPNVRASYREDPGASCDRVPDPHSPALRSIAEIFMAEDHSPADDHSSFHALITTQTTMTDSFLSDHPITDLPGKRNGQAFVFAEQSRFTDPHQRSLVEGSDLPDQERSVSFQTVTQSSRLNIMPVSDYVSSNQTSSEMGLEGSCIQCSVNVNPVTAFPNSSSSFSLASRISEWDTLSACGIMEEPELTLVSLNDSSVVCPGQCSSVLNASPHYPDQSSAESGFHALTAEVDASGATVREWSSAGLCVTDESLSQQFTEMNLELTSSSCNLQEAFLRKKKDFVDRSAKRLENLKQREGISKRTESTSSANDGSTKALERCSISAPTDVRQFKRVVEVRVCSPEDRKLTELEMQQRTIRLYNQLEEVKAKKEETIRQKSYAKNREKAEAFKKVGDR